MGITAASASFRGDPPTLDAIVATVERMSGLPLAVESRSPGAMLRFNATVGFACALDEYVEVYAYGPGEHRIPTLRTCTHGACRRGRHTPRLCCPCARVARWCPWQTDIRRAPKAMRRDAESSEGKGQASNAPTPMDH